jgi:hypothetical protein
VRRVARRLEPQSGGVDHVGSPISLHVATRRSLRKGGPTGISTLAHAWPAGGKPGADPVGQVWMLGRPRQHSAGYAEVVVLPGQALVEDTRLANLGLNIHELLIRPHTHRAVDDADPVGLHFGLEKLRR